MFGWLRIKQIRNKIEINERRTFLKRGTTVITDTFILVFSLLIITITTIAMVNILTPFIYYQKLQMTCQKYMYVVEKYGTLNNLEIQQMYKELENQGFDKSNLSINFPDTVSSYGEEIVFEVDYKYNLNIPNLDGIFNINNKEINLKVRKVSISKK